MAKLFQITETKIDSTTHLVPKVKLLSADYVQEVVDFGSGSIIRLRDNNNVSKVTERVVTEDKASVLALMDGTQGSVKALSLLVLNDGGGDVDSTVKLIPVDYVLEVETDVLNASNSIVTLINISSSKGKKYTVQETVANILTASNATSGGGGDLVSTNNLSDVANAATSLTNLGGEPSFTKNTGFNKDFGTTAGTVLEGDKNDAIVLNTAKSTNATHTGEVTGSGSLTVDPTAISNKASVTAAAGMEVLVNDAGTLKKADASDFLPNTSLYVGLSDSATLTGGTEQSLLPATGQGSLSVPANAFKVGDSFHLVMAGEIPVGNKLDDFTFKVYQDGVVLGEITVKLEDITVAGESFWEGEVDFTIRTIGVGGTVCSNIDWTFNKNLTKDFKGSRSVTVTTIDTTTASALTVTGQVVGGNGSELVTKLMTLHKVITGV